MKIKILILKQNKISFMNYVIFKFFVENFKIMEIKRNEKNANQMQNMLKKLKYRLKKSENFTSSVYHNIPSGQG